MYKKCTSNLLQKMQKLYKTLNNVQTKKQLETRNVFFCIYFSVAENRAQSITFHTAKDFLYQLLKTFTILFQIRPSATEIHTVP